MDDTFQPQRNPIPMVSELVSVGIKCAKINAVFAFSGILKAIRNGELSKNKDFTLPKKRSFSSILEAFCSMLVLERAFSLVCLGFALPYSQHFHLID